MTTLFLTPELEQEILANLRRVPGHQLAAIANLVSSLCDPPPGDLPDQEEDEDDRQLVAAMRKLSQPAFERAWEEG